MKMFNKASLSGFFGLSDEDEDDFIEEEKYGTTNTVVAQEEHSNASFFRQTAKEPERVAPVAPTESYENRRPSNKVVAMNTTQSKQSDKRDNRSTSSVSKKISVIEPRTYTESKDIAKSLFRNEIVIVNFHLVDENQARRIVDFLTGAIYAIDGDIQRIGDEIFLCTPANMEIDSSVAKSLLGSQFA